CARPTTPTARRWRPGWTRPPPDRPRGASAAARRPARAIRAAPSRGRVVRGATGRAIIVHIPASRGRWGGAGPRNFVHWRGVQRARQRGRAPTAFLPGPFPMKFTRLVAVPLIALVLSVPLGMMARAEGDALPGAPTPEQITTAKLVYGLL